MNALRSTWSVVLLWGLSASLVGQGDRAEPVASTTVGIAAVVEQVQFPGSLLRGLPVADPLKADAIVRVLKAYSHGPDAYRYDFEVLPFVAKEIDIAKHVERVDGGELGELPPVLVDVGALLPAGQLTPGELVAQDQDRLGGYGTLMTIGGIAWALGLFGILFIGRRRRRVDALLGPASIRMADRLSPFVEKARDGTLDAKGRAELERLLLSHWRHRRGLGDLSAGEAILRLRQDEEAGPLLRQLEEWLHAPAGQGAEASIAVLLEPYRDAPGEIPAVRFGQSVAEAPMAPGEAG